MELDEESWLIDIGDEIINKIAETGIDSLNNIEHAVYCLWVIDYVVRNAGSLESVEDLYPTAVQKLSILSKANGWLLNSEVEAEARNSELFCSSYYDSFDVKCGELRSAYENT